MNPNTHMSASSQKHHTTKALLPFASSSASTASNLAKGQQMAETHGAERALVAGYGSDASNRKAAQGKVLCRSVRFARTAPERNGSGVSGGNGFVFTRGLSLMARLALKAENSHDQPPVMSQRRSLS